MPEAAVVDDELAAWLSKVDLKEMAGPLSALGVETMKQLKEAPAYMTADVLKQHGAKHFQAMKLVDQIKQLVRGGIDDQNCQGYIYSHLLF